MEKNAIGKMTANMAEGKVAERREKAHLRSEKWRRAHGIMPRRSAQRPWLAEGLLALDMVSAAEGCAGAGSGGAGCNDAAISARPAGVADDATAGRSGDRSPLCGRRRGDTRRIGRDDRWCRVPVVGQLEYLQRVGRGLSAEVKEKNEGAICGHLASAFAH